MIAELEVGRAVEVTAWLRGLGLECYAEAFRAHGIDAELRPELTAKDLIGLGLTVSGHSHKLLAAVATLRDGALPRSNPSAEVECVPIMGLNTAPRLPDAERRQLTVLFGDLVGSTALATRLDPEDLREVIAAYHACCAAVIERLEGHLTRFLGDGVVAYFGCSSAHEDAAERAVRAGLALVEAVDRLWPRPDVSLQVRVGVATGLVVVGGSVASGAAREPAVVGEALNLAARLQALTEPNSVVIAPSTRRLVAGLFDLADVGAYDLKGFAEPVRAWLVLAPRRMEGRFAARRAAGLTPLVGRERGAGRAARPLAPGQRRRGRSRLGRRHRRPRRSRRGRGG